MNTGLHVSIQDRLGVENAMKLFSSFGQQNRTSDISNSVSTIQSNHERCEVKKDVDLFLSEIRAKRQHVFEQTGKYRSLLQAVTLNPSSSGWHLYKEVVSFIKTHRTDHALSNNQCNLLNRYLFRAKISLLRARAKRQNEMNTAMVLASRVNSAASLNEFRSLRNEIYSQIGPTLNRNDFYRYVVPAIVNTKFRFLNSYNQ